MNDYLAFFMLMGLGMLVVFLAKAAWAVIRFILKILVVLILICGFVNHACFVIAIVLALLIVLGNLFLEM